MARDGPIIHQQRKDSTAHRPLYPLRVPHIGRDAWTVGGIRVLQGPKISSARPWRKVHFERPKRFGAEGRLVKVMRYWWRGTKSERAIRLLCRTGATGLGGTPLVLVS